MFLDNKYTNWYNLLIKSRIMRRENDINCYYEKHHIVPRCVGGNNTKSNIVLLTPKEHFIAHLLLTKMFAGSNKYKMEHAFTMMLVKSSKNSLRNIKSCRLYQILREKVGKKIGESNKGKIPWNKGIKRTDDLKAAVSKANKGRPAWNKGVKRTDAEKQAMKDGWKNRLEKGHQPWNKKS